MNAIQNDLNKFTKYSIKNNYYKLDKFVEMKNISQMYFFAKLFYLNNKKYKNKSKKIGGRIFKQSEEWITSNIDVMYSLYHGRIDNMEQFIVPNNVYLVIPLCCGFYNWTSSSLTNFLSKDVQKIKEIINESEFIVKIMSNNYVILKPDDTYCDVFLSITYENFFLTPFGLRFIDEPDENKLINNYNNLILHTTPQMYKTLELMEHIHLFMNRGLIIDNDKENFKNILNMIEHYKNINSQTNPQLFKNFILYFFQIKCIKNFHFFQSILNDNRSVILNVDVSKINFNTNTLYDARVDINDKIIYISTLLNFLSKSDNNDYLRIKNDLIGVINCMITDIIYSKSKIFLNNNTYLNFISKILPEINFTLETSYESKLFEFNSLELSGINISIRNNINNNDIWKDYNKDKLHVLENHTDYTNNFNNYKYKYITWLKWNIYNLYHKIIHVSKISWFETNFYKKIVNENKKFSLKYLVEYISEYQPEKIKFLLNFSCQGFNNGVCENVKCIRHLYTNIKNNYQVSNVFNQNNILELYKLMSMMNKGIGWNKPRIQSDNNSSTLNNFVIFFSSIFQNELNKKEIEINLSEVLHNSQLASNILLWYFINYNNDFLNYFKENEQIFKYRDDITNTMIIYFNVALTNYYDNILEAIDKKTLMVNILGEKIIII